MIHIQKDPNVLDISPTETASGALDRTTIRHLDAEGQPKWGLTRTASNSLELYNYETEHAPIWVTDDDTLHVQSIAIEGESGIDAGTLDGLDSSQFVRSDEDDTIHAGLAVAGSLTQGGDDVLTTSDEGSLDAGTLDGATLAETRPAVVDDGTAVETAAVELTTGQYLQATADGNGGVTIDSLGGNAVGSTASATGDGTTTTFTLSHDLDGTPATVDVTPLTEGAMADHYVSTVRADDLDVTYASPPADGETLEWHVTAFGSDGSGLHSVQINDSGTGVDRANTIDFADGLDVSHTADGEVSVSSPPGVEVRDSGASQQADTAHIDFAGNLDVTVDGDGVAVAAADTYPAVAADGDEVDAAPGVLDFGNNLSVTETSEGVTIHASSNASTLGGVSASNYLRSDSDDTHEGTLSLTTLGAAGDTVALSDDIEPEPGVGLASTVGSSHHHITPRREGLQSLSQGTSLPTDYGAVVEADATLAFVEADNDRVSGWVDTNNDSLTMAGGIRVGDDGGAPDDGLALDVRGPARIQLEMVDGDPADPEPGQMWMDTSAFN